MPDVLDATGLTTKTLTEIRDELEEDLQDIYGTDINTDQNSPDGQQINIYAQGGVDLRELLEQINASFDPDQAEGTVLDQRVGINGIIRTAGTFTFQDVSITTDRALNLVGLDAAAGELEPDIENLYTVKDDEGTEFYLLVSQTIVGAGTNSYEFRAAELGLVEVVTNTITTAVTVIAGVTGINNPTAPNSVGINEETDANLKLRRRTSISIPAIGYLDSIEAALNNLDNVTIANVYENDTNVIDADGIPPHSIWAIIEGGDTTEIAETIYAKKSSGSGMKGDETVNLTRPNGDTYQVKFDRPDSEDLYIQFKLTGDTYVAAEVKAAIVENITWEIGKGADGSEVTAYLKTLNPNFIIEDMEISDDGAAWVEVLDSTTLKDRFVNDIGRITIT